MNFYSEKKMGDVTYYNDIDKRLDEIMWHMGLSGYFTHTCTTALEIAALALNIKEGDEIIMPSYTFVSTGNAFVLRGAKLVFCDVDQNMNMDVESLEALINDKTRVIVPVHYGGSSCDMTRLMALAKKHNLCVVEDAAQALGCKYDDQYLGTFGDLSCFSFHETKNVHCYEGGYIAINNNDLKTSVEQIMGFGTDRKAYQRGEIDSYSWKCVGVSGEMDQLRKQYLYQQLLSLDTINLKRRFLCNVYQEELKGFDVFEAQETNGHIFFMRCNSKEERISLQNHLREKCIESHTHYHPLHLSDFGSRFTFHESLGYTNQWNRLLRLPVHEELSEKEIMYIALLIKEFYHV